ncbi:GNAT family N-acetyltransferase [Pontixanthobacter aquaemixtae]|uniref:N-acetyltransferase n=1 Tax=Pontixanthobacter aquaemixtae TaxID=1958940 RepID=A0A844ZXB1_9SPHN|nr:N-acetyltransferase [Pontixanthobacter aquaemixtae]
MQRGVIVPDDQIVITPVVSKADRKAFVDLGMRFAASTPHSVPQLRGEMLELIDPAKNPFFEHARVALFIAHRTGRPVGRISAQIDELALKLPAKQGMGPGTGMFGYFDAEDETVGRALLDKAEDWLRSEGMTRVLGPISMSIWEEPGLLTFGHDHSPTIMMGHHPAHYQGWIENYGYSAAKRLLTYHLDTSKEFSPLIQRIVKSGERNPKIVMRGADKNNFASEVRIILDILNDAWSDNWGFVPFTDREIAYAAKKLKPLVHSEIVRIVELEGVPSAFMITLPDVNKVLKEIDGKLLPFGWFKLLRWSKNPVDSDMRVPLMGVLKKHHNSRLASQLAFMMIDGIRRDAHAKFNTQRAEVGWILDDNQGMVAIAEAIESTINREYLIYEKPLLD